GAVDPNQPWRVRHRRKQWGDNSPMLELLRDLYRRADGGVLKKPSRHPLWQSNTTMGSSKGWHIALMHRVAAPEEHGIGHLRTVEMRARRTPILPSVNV